MSIPIRTNSGSTLRARSGVEQWGQGDGAVAFVGTRRPYARCVKGGFGSYMIDGGDIVRTAIDYCRQKNLVPFFFLSA